jgi:uncharacterized membrane protein YheB (UPF0754 family)
MSKETVAYFFPVIAAFIGWATNYIAVKMLFHPRKEVNLFFMSIQGVFPKRQKKLAEELGKIVADELFSMADVKSHMASENMEQLVREIAEPKIDTFMKEKIVAALPMAAMFINGPLGETIKQQIIDEVTLVAQEFKIKFLEKMEADIDVKKVVYEKVANFSSDKLEEILFAIMKKEFRFIEFVGGVLGFFIGLVQMLLIIY